MDAAKKRKVIHAVYEAAKNFGGIDFLYLMVRIEGMKTDWTDNFVKLSYELKSSPSSVSKSDLLHDDFLKFIANLINVAGGKPYVWAPLHKLGKGLGRLPSSTEKLQFLILNAREKGLDDFAEVLKLTYQPTIELSKIENPSKTETSNAANASKSFMKLFLAEYFQQLRKFRGHQKYTKIGYQIFELLIDDEKGLYGFYSHYPGGGKSWWIRSEDHVDCANLVGTHEVQPFVGIIPFEDEWRVNGKRLHELQLSGRYNHEGYWKPILYPANPQPLIDEAVSLSDDPEIQGCLFYILATGYRGIEFVIKTNIHLPYETGNIGNQVHLYRCTDHKEQNAPASDNVQIYDGWFPLESLNPNEIRGALEVIGRVVNRLVLAYNGVAKWRVKYRFYEKLNPLLEPPVESMNAFNQLLLQFPIGNDADVLDFAIDWYRRARSEANIFAEFLYYYVSVESVAQAVWSGTADFGLGLVKETKSERRTKRRECIERKYHELYAKNPAEFVKDAYFNCVTSLKETTKKIVELVFGKGHPYNDLLFTKSADDNKSLSDLRSEIAHGSISMLSRKEERIVNRRLPQMERIARDFLTRLALSLRADEDIPANKIPFTSSQPLSDPRNCIAVHDVQGVVNLDEWRIKSEWIS